MRNLMFASACAAALLVSGAASAQVTGTLGGGYSRITDNGGADIYGVNGSLATGSIGNSGFSFEGTGSYYNANPGGLDLWTMGGNVYTNSFFGRMAFGAMHGGVGFGHATSYGVGADWFVSDDITLSLKGGGNYATGGNTGGYVGLQGMYYVTPNLALSASADYAGNSSNFGTSLGDLNTEKLRAEWQFSDSLPFSVYGGYQRYEVAGTESNAIFVGVKFYMDGASTLVGHHRTGSLGYIGQSFYQLGSY
jgi:hypothetical protein